MTPRPIIDVGQQSWPFAATPERRRPTFAADEGARVWLATRVAPQRARRSAGSVGMTAQQIAGLAALAALTMSLAAALACSAGDPVCTLEAAGRNAAACFVREEE